MPRPSSFRRSAIALAMVAALLAPARTIPAVVDPPLRIKLPDLGESFSDDLSPQMEKKLGDEIMRQAHEGGDVLEDAETTEWLNRFADALVSKVGAGETRAFDFFVVSDPTVNAFALPGGYIGIHSGLIVATQSESELASVIAHEMGHVIQRHIARSIARQKETNLIALAATLLGILAASRAKTGDAGQAAVAAGTGYAIQDQLNFGRDAEREADRVGFGILERAGFDVTGMSTFFGRMQQATRLYDNGTPAFLLSHPLTTERMADVQNRIREAPYRQRADGLDFFLVRARMRVLQGSTTAEVRDARAAFEDQLKKRAYANEVAAHYGLAVALLKLGDAAGAAAELERCRALVPVANAILSNFAIDVKQAAGDAAGAVAAAEAARRQFPQSRMIAQNYADTLQQANRHAEAIAFLRDQLTLYRSEPALYELLAKSYAASGDAMVSHRLLGEAYLLRGSVAGALEQMRIARQVAPRNADFHELSQIDARARELTARLEEIRKAERERR